MRALGANRKTLYDSLLTVWVGDLERGGTNSKVCIAMADDLVVQFPERNVGLSTRVQNLNTAFATSRAEDRRLNGELTPVRDELTAVYVEDTRSANIWEVKQFVTDLAQRVEDANLNNEMSVSVRQELVGGTRSVVAGFIRMEALNTTAVFEYVADCLNVGIFQIIAGRKVFGTVIVEQSYRELERNNTVGTLYPEGEYPSGFEVTAAQRRQFLSTF